MTAIFDSGTSFIYVARSHINDFLYRMLKGKYYYRYSNGIYVISCSQKDLYRDVEFYIDGYWFIIYKHDYIFEIDDTCILAFTENQGDFWLLGDTFLRGYYVIHDNRDRNAA